MKKLLQCKALQEELDIEHRLYRDLQQKIGKRRLDWGEGKYC